MPLAAADRRLDHGRGHHVGQYGRSVPFLGPEAFLPPCRTVRTVRIVFRPIFTFDAITGKRGAQCRPQNCSRMRLNIQCLWRSGSTASTMVHKTRRKSEIIHEAETRLSRFDISSKTSCTLQRQGGTFGHRSNSGRQAGTVGTSCAPYHLCKSN